MQFLITMKLNANELKQWFKKNLKMRNLNCLFEKFVKFKDIINILLAFLNECVTI